MSAEEVLRGDVVVLEAVNRVSADLRLLREQSLRINEPVLTGESVPIDKTEDPVPASSPLSDRTGMAFPRAPVTAGQASAVVVLISAATELGRINGLLEEVRELRTPLLAQMGRFARQVTLPVLVVAVLTLGFAVLARGWNPVDAFIAIVGLAVAAIPEGLLAVMTIALAVVVRRMGGAPRELPPASHCYDAC